MNDWLQSAYQDFLDEHEIDPDEESLETMSLIYDAYVAGFRQAGDYARQAILDGSE